MGKREKRGGFLKFWGDADAIELYTRIIWIISYNAELKSQIPKFPDKVRFNNEKKNSEAPFKT